MESEHVGSGNVRYTVSPEASFKIAAKQIAGYPAPASGKAAEKMLADFDAAMGVPRTALGARR